MEKLNRDNLAPERKAIFSETAKRTSARRDIQLQRAERLKRWREENPEKFKKTIQLAMKSPKKSKMESWLRDDLGWKSRYVRCGDDRKFVDMANGKIWIEVDGCFHFWEVKRKNSKRPHNFKRVQERDNMLKEEALRRKNITLIRLSMSCFYRKGRMKEEWYTLLLNMLRSPKPGVFCAGEFYEHCPWADSSVTILKSPVLPTTSSCPMG
jgi:hypothetical protein